MQVQVLLFGPARTAIGREAITLVLDDSETARGALMRVCAEHPALAPLAPHLALAVDGELVRGDAPLRAGAELALLPPVSGG